ncbi:MAG: hypothetical protein LBO72_02405 [Helicobacteraceae bacterium]|jgi:alpha-tubulin suppressor-like RCC1 family protein|nr:hypothetical protein [Helicobacteraceae bacterium]
MQSPLPAIDANVKSNRAKLTFANRSSLCYKFLTIAIVSLFLVGCEGCKGSNDNSDIENRDNNLSAKNIVPKEAKFKIVAAGNYHSLALDGDGKVYATGANWSGQLGLGGNITDSNAFTLVTLLADKNITAIAAGYRHSLAIDSDGKVYATGFNGYGQLGLGDTDDRKTFVEIASLKGKKIVSVAAGDHDSFAIGDNGKVYATGENRDGQLGLGDTSDRKTFVEIASLKGKKIIAVAAGGAHSLALSDDGKVYATSANRLGDKASLKTFTEITSLSDKKIIAVAAGGGHSLALDESGKVYAAGANIKGRLGLGDEKYSKTFVEVGGGISGKKIVSVAAGDRNSFAIGDNGKVYATGENRDGQLGLGDTDDRKTFVEIASLSDKNITAIAAGGAHSLALSDDDIYAAGKNIYGQLGLGYDEYHGSFVQSKLVNNARIISIVAVGFYSLALDESGKVYAAGSNLNGQLGLGDTNNRKAFTEIASLSDKNITAIAADEAHSLALSDDDKVYATGNAIAQKVYVTGNGTVQLGFGDARLDVDSRSSFTEVTLLSDKNITAVAAGNDHSLALDESGKVYAVGDNRLGQLGLGDKNITAIAAGRIHSLALDESGKVYATGNNFKGQLGLGDTNNRKAFTEVGGGISGKKIVAIAAGLNHSLALDESGKVYAVGDNYSGQLGLGDRGGEIHRKTFELVAFPNDINITAIAAGEVHSLALGKDGNIYGAGADSFGALGLDRDYYETAFKKIKRAE